MPICWIITDTNLVQGPKPAPLRSSGMSKYDAQISQEGGTWDGAEIPFGFWLNKCNLLQTRIDAITAAEPTWLVITKAAVLDQTLQSFTSGDRQATQNWIQANFSKDTLRYSLAALQQALGGNLNQFKQHTLRDLLNFLAQYFNLAMWDGTQWVYDGQPQVTAVTPDFLDKQVV